MCFSAVGSFALSGVLGGIGSRSIQLNPSRPLRLFAAIPLVFAVQQGAEGMVWLTVANPTHAAIQGIAVNLFLGIAVVVWPIWCPVALWLAEEDATRRRVLWRLSAFGMGSAVGALGLLIYWAPTAVIAGHSVRYDHGGWSPPWFGLITLAAYVVPTVVPYFVSTTRLARTLGVMFVVSLVVTIVVRQETLTSVWCFFAALLSGMVLFAVRERRRAFVAVPDIVAGS